MVTLSALLYVMLVFTLDEVEFLVSQPLARLATASADGMPDLAVVPFDVVDGCVVMGEVGLSKTVRYQFVHENPRAMVVVDDVVSLHPFVSRGVKVRGGVVVEVVGGVERLRVVPEVVWSWGVNGGLDASAAMTRRAL